MSHSQMAPTPIKLVRAALDIPRTKVAVPEGNPGGVDGEWYQRQLVNPPDSGDVMDSATADHRSMRMFEIDFWYHQVAIVLEGEMVCQDLATGAVYRGHEGDVFHWAPGLRLQFGGRFRALGTKTPIPMRWVETPQGKRERLMYTLPDEIRLEGAPRDETRRINRPTPPEPRRRIKLVRGAMSYEPAKVESRVNRGGDWWRVALVDPIEHRSRRERLHRGEPRWRARRSRSPMARGRAGPRRRPHYREPRDGRGLPCGRRGSLLLGAGAPAAPRGRVPHLLGQDTRARDQRLRSRRGIPLPGRAAR